MSISNDTAYLWHFEGRDRAITAGVLDGVSPTLMGRLHGLRPLRVHLIVRRTCARLRPDLVDADGYPLAWYGTLKELRRVRRAFAL